MSGKAIDFDRKRKKKRSGFSAVLRGFLGVAALVLILGAANYDVIKRAHYALTGGGLESWENAALEEGFVSSVEEYYYDNLPEKYHEAYREIYVHIMRGEDAGDFMAVIGGDEFWDVYYAVLADHPEIFWIGASAQIETDFSGRMVGYKLETTVPAEARPSMRQNLEVAADECIARIPSIASDYERIKYVYEYLIDTVEYRAGSADSQNIQSALLYHTSVCAGYAKAFQYILHRMGLFCTYITGKTKDGGDHGWNMVRIDGEYYYVDVTWGDPVFAEQADGENSENVTNYNYLCCTEYDLFKTHVPDDSIPLPPCTSDKYDYYKLNGYYYEFFDYDTIHSALMNSVWNGESSIVMKFGSSEALEDARYWLFEGGMLDEPGQYLMDLSGVTTWNYRYHVDDEFCLITIYW